VCTRSSAAAPERSGATGGGGRFRPTAPPRSTEPRRHCRSQRHD
jgi:hypothetical protein